MNFKEKIILALCMVPILGLLFFIVYGDKGLVDLSALKEERARLVRKKEEVEMDNRKLIRVIRRLKNDSGYIENVARGELGMVAEEDLIFKFSPDKREAGQ